MDLPHWLYLGMVALLLLSFADAPWKAFKAKQSRRPPPQHYTRSNAIASLIGILWLVTLVVPGADLRLQTWPEGLGWVPFAGLVLAALGTVLAIWGRLVLGAWFFPTAAVLPEQTVVQHGPYGWVRHPFYAGWWLLLFAGAFVLASVAALVAALLLAPLVRQLARGEEQLLLSELGSPYRDYMARVPRFLPWQRGD